MATRNKPRKHKDVQFHVSEAYSRKTKEHVFDTFDEAAVFAVVNATMSGKSMNLDVITWSVAGARWYGGDDGVEQYRGDPEASVFDRIEIKCNQVGRIA